MPQSYNYTLRFPSGNEYKCTVDPSCSELAFEPRKRTIQDLWNEPLKHIVDGEVVTSPVDTSKPYQSIRPIQVVMDNWHPISKVNWDAQILAGYKTLAKHNVNFLKPEDRWTRVKFNVKCFLYRWGVIR